MKKYLIVAILLLLAPAAFASLDVDDVRGYVNNDRVLNVDENGGDFDLQQGDSLDLIVRIRNDVNTTDQAKLDGTIYSIDDNADITKTQAFYDIPGNDNVAKTLSFAIPSNARADQYDMRLRVFNSNDTVIRTINFDVIVDRDSTEDTVATNDLLSNLTASCNAIVATTNTCFGYIASSSSCNSELSTVKEERGTYKTQSEECVSTKASLENQNAELQNQLANSMTVTECNNQTTSAIIAVREENNSKFNQNLMIIAAIGLIVWQYQKKKKEKSSVPTSYDPEYFNQG